MITLQWGPRYRCGEGWGPTRSLLCNILRQGKEAIISALGWPYHSMFSKWLSGALSPTTDPGRQHWPSMEISIPWGTLINYGLKEQTHGWGDRPLPQQGLTFSFCTGPHKLCSWPWLCLLQKNKPQNLYKHHSGTSLFNCVFVVETIIPFLSVTKSTIY